MAGPLGNQLPFDLETQSAAIQRRRVLADVLAKQAMQGSPGQMVGKYFVPTSPWEHLARLGTAYMSGEMQRGADSDQRELVGQYNTKLTEGLDKYFQTRQGQAAIPPTAAVPAQDLPTEDGIGYSMPENPGMPGRAAVPGDPRRAAVQALTSGLPALAKLGQSDLEALSKNVLTQKDLLSVPGASVASRVAAAQGLDPSRLVADPKLQVINDQLFSVPEGSGDPQLRLDARSKFGSPFDIRGTLFQNDLNTGKIEPLDKAAKVTIGNTSIEKGTNAGVEELAKLAAKTVNGLAEGARASAKTLTALNNVVNTADAGVFQGPLANFGIFLGQLGAAAGLRVDANKLSNSETFNSEIVRLWAEMMQANGGARGLVKEESEKMMSSLPQLAQTPEGRMQIIKILRMKAEQDIQIAQQASKEFIEAVQSGDWNRFTFGLSNTMLPSPAMDPKPGIPAAGAGGGAGTGLQLPEGFRVIRKLP